MSKISAFILDSKKYQAEQLRRFLENKVDISVLSKDQKIYSRFIRYFVFENFFDIFPIFSTLNAKPYLTNSDLFFNISHTQDIIVNHDDFYKKICHSGFDPESPSRSQEILNQVQDDSVGIQYSRTDYIVMVVASSEIGVDIEIPNQKRNALRIAKRYFTAEEYDCLEKSEQLEKDFYTLWTLKEAQVKRSSLGIAKELSEAVFHKNRNQQWCSKKYPNDFNTYSYNDLIVSVCCENLAQKQIVFYEIEDFKFKKLELKGEYHGIAP